ncbi:hypothetical protein FRC06_002244 [Ceratobasidium sp. 370]|nr:hypothetical protein FRC06_002244 [Ceratobasidium sp. 370]
MAPISTQLPMLDEQRSLTSLRLLNTSQHQVRRNVDVLGKGGLSTEMEHTARVMAVHPQNANPPYKLANPHQQKVFAVLARQPDTQIIMAPMASTRTVMDITMAATMMMRTPPRRSNNAPVAANNSHGGTNPHEDASSLMDVVVAHPSDDEEHSFRPPEEPLYSCLK